MSTELEDLEERVEHLEKILDTLQSRFDMFQVHLQILSDRRPPKPSDDVAGPQASRPGEDVTLTQIDARLRSMILNQGQHTSDLRSAVQYLKELAGRQSRNG